MRTATRSYLQAVVAARLAQELSVKVEMELF